MIDNRTMPAVLLGLKGQQTTAASSARATTAMPQDTRNGQAWRREMERAQLAQWFRPVERAVGAAAAVPERQPEEPNTELGPAPIHNRVSSSRSLAPAVDDAPLGSAVEHATPDDVSPRASTSNTQRANTHKPLADKPRSQSQEGLRPALGTDAGVDPSRTDPKVVSAIAPTALADSSERSDPATSMTDLMRDERRASGRSVPHLSQTGVTLALNVALNPPGCSPEPGIAALARPLQGVSTRSIVRAPEPSSATAPTSAAQWNRPVGMVGVNRLTGLRCADQSQGSDAERAVREGPQPLQERASDESSRPGQAKPLASGESSPLRVHSQTSQDGVRIWFGMDTGYAGYSVRSELIVSALRTTLAAQGQLLRAVTFNGRQVFKLRELEDGFESPPQGGADLSPAPEAGSMPAASASETKDRT